MQTRTYSVVAGLLLGSAYAVGGTTIVAAAFYALNCVVAETVRRFGSGYSARKISATVFSR
jgi:hypothetical protein